MIDQPFFREAYDADPDNQKLQKWDGDDGYWWWVEYFYKNDKWGGWGNVEIRLLKQFIGSPTDAFSHIQESLIRLGKRICAEWAKHNDMRKINSDDVEQYLKKLENVSVLEIGIEELEKELNQREVGC